MFRKYLHHDSRFAHSRTSSDAPTGNQGASDMESESAGIIMSRTVEVVETKISSTTSTLCEPPFPPPRQDSGIDLAGKSAILIEEHEIALPSIRTTERTTQKALTVASKGTYELTEAFPLPHLESENEVMIKTAAVGLNHIDWKSVEYNFCLPAFPWVTGREMAGVVEEVGADVTRFQPGDRVWTGTHYKDIRAGCFQEYCVVPQHTVSAIPGDLTDAQAACLGAAGVSAAMTLWKWLAVPMSSPSQTPSPASPKEGILIWGGSTTTGQFAIQLAARAGLEVTAVASERTKALVQSLGATHVITRDGKTNEEVEEAIRAAGGDTITRGIDLVGPETGASALNVLSTTQSCHFAPLAFLSNDQVVPENVTVHAVQMQHFVLDEGCAVYAEELNRLVGEGLIKVPEIELVEGGLGGIQQGLERLKKGDMEGKKLIVSFIS